MWSEEASLVLVFLYLNLMRLKAALSVDEVAFLRLREKENRMTDLLDEKQAGSEFNISHHSLRVSRSKGVLYGVPAPKFVRIGRKCFYKRETLEKWFAQFEEVEPEEK